MDVQWMAVPSVGSKKSLPLNFRLVLSGYMLLLSMQASAVLFDGKDWAQPANFTGFSWDEIATVCPAGAGPAREGSHCSRARIWGVAL
jgi:hypothetical protein